MNNHKPTRDAPWADDQTLEVVRPEVRRILEAAPAFSQLSDQEKRDLAGKMVKVASYMSNPDGLAAKELSPDGGLLVKAQAQEDPVEATKRRLSQKPGSTGEEFKAGAVREGVEQFGALVQKVDFPKFVSGLIKGVFEAIVDSSIEQMRAYGELLANVAKTVDQFAQDNITENNARDWLAQRFPDQLEIETTESSFGLAESEEQPPPQPRVVAKGEDPEAAATTVSQLLELAKPVTDLSDPNEELRLVLAARTQMARSRQQLLSSMVMLGINRIVVTDGVIDAKVIFDMRASDMAKRRARASMYDRRQETSSTHAAAAAGGWFGGFGIGGGVSSSSSSDHVATVSSSIDDTSESKAEVKARLSGQVRVNFKSDYFPMEKLASPQMIAAIQGNAQPPEKRLEGA